MNNRENTAALHFQNEAFHIQLCSSSSSCGLFTFRLMEALEMTVMLQSSSSRKVRLKTFKSRCDFLWRSSIRVCQEVRNWSGRSQWCSTFSKRGPGGCDPGISVSHFSDSGNVHPNCWFRRRKVDHELSVEHWTRSLSSCELLVGSLEFSSSWHVLWRRPWPCFPGNPVRGNEALSHTGASFLSSCSWWDRISRYSWGERSVLWGISELRFCFLQMT